MYQFRDQLGEAGIVDSRRYKLAEAASAVHHAESQLDSYNLEMLRQSYPEFVRLAEAFGKTDVFLRDDFGGDQS